jgi:hypothetical protein
MPPLTANKDTEWKEGKLESFLIEDNVHIYKGALVCLNADGYAVPAADADGYTLQGEAYEERDNTLIGHSQGGKSVRVRIGGILRVAASSITQAMVGQMMYVVDDQTVDDDPGTHGIKAGRLVECESVISGWIQLPVGGAGQGAISPDATDEASAIVLVNELKGIVNTYLG